MTVSRIFLVLSLLVLGACARQWATDYDDVVDAEQSRNWRIAAIDVTVPDTLTVSEANTYAPEADIVWRGDPLGDRRAQVRAIIADAARRGTAGMRGNKPVRLQLQVTQFHSVTEKTRYGLSNSGVHNIKFTARVVDARSGAVLVEPDLVQAELPAYAGEQAIEAERRGQTQKVRITSHVANVIAGWLGRGPDPRGTFYRSGR